MRIAIDAIDAEGDRAEIRLLPDDQLVIGVFTGTVERIRLVCDVPKWVKRQTVEEMQACGRYIVAESEPAA